MIRYLTQLSNKIWDFRKIMGVLCSIFRKPPQMKKIFLLLFLFIKTWAFAQEKDSTKTSYLGGQITATNNGVALIPSFSLGKPAILFDMNLGKGRVSFDPMLRFAMNGKPWAFIFWWRYKLIDQEKWSMGIGAHPSVIFNDVTILENGVSHSFLVANRFFAMELSPTYHITKKASVGFYTLKARSLGRADVLNNTFLAVRGNISDIRIAPRWLLSVGPQMYFLKMNEKTGIYGNISVSIRLPKSPISVSGLINHAFQTEIDGKRTLYSGGLVYHLDNRYKRLR